MEADTSFVRTYGSIELHTVAKVGLYLSLVINPIHTESMDTIRLYNTLNDFCLSKFRMLVIDLLYGFQHFMYSL